MDARHFETFHAVLRHGSLLAAARSLGCAQSTVTVRIQELEAELSVRLFARKGRRVVLTEAGRAVAEQTRQIADNIAALKGLSATFGAGVAGRVRLGAIEPTASHRLPAILSPFCVRRPGLSLAIEVGGANRVSQLVSDGELDLGISSPPDRDLPLDFEWLFEEPMTLLAPVRHPLASRRRVSASDLIGHRMLLTDRSCAYRDVVEAGLGARGVTLQDVLEVGSFDALRHFVAEGLGLGLVPARGTARSRATVTRRIHGVDLALPVGLLTRRGSHLTPAQEAVRQLVRRLRRRTRSV